jgi:hypothetical protein
MLPNDPASRVTIEASTMTFTATSAAQKNALM